MCLKSGGSAYIVKQKGGQKFIDNISVWNQSDRIIRRSNKCETWENVVLECEKHSTGCAVLVKVGSGWVMENNLSGFEFLDVPYLKSSS
jgi:hypothetical protein